VAQITWLWRAGSGDWRLVGDWRAVTRLSGRRELGKVAMPGADRNHLRCCGEPSVGRERAQGSQGHDPPPFGDGGLAGWLPGGRPATVGLPVFCSRSRWAPIWASVNSERHRKLACGAMLSGDRP
jgi:hypothetical protein